MIRPPRAFPAAAVEGLGTFTIVPTAVLLFPVRPVAAATYSLPWAGITIHYPSSA